MGEGFAGVPAVAVGEEDFFDERGQFVGADAAEDFAGDALFVIHAAAEAAVGLALIIAVYRHQKNIRLQEANTLKG